MGDFGEQFGDVETEHLAHGVRAPLLVAALAPVELQGTRMFDAEVAAIHAGRAAEGSVGWAPARLIWASMPSEHAVLDSR
jgi:hypothetical protein